LYIIKSYFVLEKNYNTFIDIIRVNEIGDKTYKYRIRTYRKVNGKTLFGAYSAVKSVTTKK
ncbi:MAG: hypothetical protein LUE12_03410, partial [Ruminococcus sp.]|nr:hypothetical protein [Ruminococcus sp.]